MEVTMRTISPRGVIWAFAGVSGPFLFVTGAFVTGARPAVAQERFEYAAKVVCGIQKDPKDLRLARGLYATTVNVHNPSAGPARIMKKLALTFPPGNQKPGEIRRLAEDTLESDQALETDCMDIRTRAFNGVFPTPYIEGFVVIQSPTSLDVTAVYTTARLSQSASGVDHTSIDVVQVHERRGGGGGQLPDLVPVPSPAGGFCVRHGDQLLVTVRNQGAAAAGPSTTRVDFGAFGSPTQPTPPLAPGASTVLTFTIPTSPNCFNPDCEFKITVDSAGVVTESDEANNVAIGVCLG